MGVAAAMESMHLNFFVHPLQGSTSLYRLLAMGNWLMMSGKMWKDEL